MFDENRDLLAELGRYRRSARDRVKATMDQLMQLSEDLSDLRDRVAQPAMIGADTTVPLEVHLDSLRRGVDRLGSFRQKGLDRYVSTYTSIRMTASFNSIILTGRTSNCGTSL